MTEIIVTAKKKQQASKKLQGIIQEAVSNFGKLNNKVNEAIAQGKSEGFSKKEIGSMIREGLIKAGYSRMTFSRNLPTELKFKPRGKPSGNNKNKTNNDEFSNKMLLTDATTLDKEDKDNQNNVDEQTDKQHIKELQNRFETMGSKEVEVIEAEAKEEEKIVTPVAAVTTTTTETATETAAAKTTTLTEEDCFAKLKDLRQRADFDNVCKSSGGLKAMFKWLNSWTDINDVRILLRRSL